MSRICRVTAPASRDIEAIMDYVAANSSFDAAERLLDKIEDKCKKLISFPSMGQKRDQLALNVRSFPVDSYLIFYRAIADGVEILRVVSGYRDLKDLFLEQDEN